MTWERAVLWIIAGMLVAGMVKWIAVAREGRRGREQRCDFCSFTGTRHDRCRCREQCASPRCDPQRETESLQERRAA